MKSLHYQSPEVHELAQFRPVPWGISEEYSHDVWLRYAADHKLQQLALEFGSNASSEIPTSNFRNNRPPLF